MRARVRVAPYCTRVCILCECLSCVYASVYACVCVRMCVCVYIYVYVSVCVHFCGRVRMYACCSRVKGIEM